MKIKHLLNESNDELFEKIVNSRFFKENYEDKVRHAIQNDIELHYIDDIAWLFHASSKLDKKGGVLNLKLREVPRDTNPLFHHIVNSVAEKELGVPVRNLMFSYTKKHKIVDYGFNDYVLFPLDDDYHLYYADMIDDMTTHYNVSVFSEKRLEKIFDQFVKKYDLKNISIQGNINDHTIRFNNISNEDELYEFSKSIIRSESGDYSEEELVKLFTSFVKQNLVDKAEHYIGRMVDTKTISKRDEEYLILSKNIAYLNTDNLFSWFKNEYLYQKYR